MENKQVIFFPKTLLGTSDSTVELVGFIKLIKNVRYYFVLPNYIKNTCAGSKVNTIGHFTRNDCRVCFKRTVTNTLCITEINGNLNASLLPGQLDNFVLIIYDASRLYDYGTLFKYEGDSQKFICFIMLSKWLSNTENAERQSHLSEVQVIKVLQGTLQWLMGSPAGLKLNDPLNSLLGTCFLYLVNLWWSFLVLCRPFLELTFQVYVFIGIFGLSYQIAIIEDVLAIVSFHVYCIYVYAAWLYNLQRKSLMILAKLFVGRSCNPQPGRTTPYTTQQLYVGTISFAILLFLLPTTLIYYIVFVVMRTIMVMAKGILIRLRYVLQVLPVYTTLIWFVKPSSSADSWWSTVKHYLPELVEQPPPVSWMTLTKRVCTGKILYPI
ncbi:phosphatidylinositol N-acetylglucosaminyltransferase subunit Q [Aphis craccivora]|uniref:Phosphatidylinositol N-acetylglucosaminyltransferase subunit Q n=1 Tax=Aphis craccivora TaxID=307492 RepID=A0A6G0YM04_APHCR|nr:phosphatidylinositol N-acetylglucosaminyltransferase subunit Q [Aphis craccivora]